MFPITLILFLVSVICLTIGFDWWKADNRNRAYLAGLVSILCAFVAGLTFSSSLP